MSAASVIVILVGIFVYNTSCGHWHYASHGENRQNMRRQIFFQNHNGPEAEHYHYQQLIANRQQPCNCIKLKFCDPILEMARKMYSGFIGDYIHSQLQVIACNYIDGEMAVCCPKTGNFNEDSREKRGGGHRNHANVRGGHEKWVWDTEELTSSEEVEQRPYQLSPTQLPATFYQSYPIQGFLPFSKSNLKINNKKSPFLANHEDPLSMKNCPPAFSAEFKLPSNHTFYKEPTPEVTTEQPTTIIPRVQMEVPKSFTMTSQMQLKMRMINDETCGTSIGNRIVGGEDAGIGRFSWMARLAYRNRTSGRISYRCAGSLIADKWIITAGHCVTNLIDSLQLTMIRLSDVNSDQENECNENGEICMQEEDFEIERIIVHPNYNNPRYANDIALIQLKQSTAASSSIGTICLPIGIYEETARNISEGTNGIVAGWGARSRNIELPSASLQWIRLPFVDTAACSAFYANYTSNFRSRIMISNSQLCIQGRDNMDACAGDSGGPLMNEADLGNDKFVLLGLVSFGPRLCGLSNFPGVYTRVSSYMEWILKTIEP